jgi:predicted membrane protein
MESNSKKEKSLFFHWKRLLNYRAIVRQIPFFLFLALLAVIYIYNGHLADKTAREITRTANELKELQFEYKDVKGDVLKRSTQSELIDAVQPLGLKELVTSPVVLIDSAEGE